MPETFRHLMGMGLEEAMEFFIGVLRKLGFRVEVPESISGKVIRAQRGDVRLPYASGSSRTDSFTYPERMS